MATKAELTAALATVLAVGDVIREVGRAPAGPVYAALMTAGVSYEGFERIVDTLVKAKVVRRDGHELVWIGPAAKTDTKTGG